MSNLNHNSFKVERQNQGEIIQENNPNIDRRVDRRGKTTQRVLRSRTNPNEGSKSRSASPQLNRQSNEMDSSILAKKLKKHFDPSELKLSTEPNVFLSKASNILSPKTYDTDLSGLR